ncbi:MAG: DNA repair protein RecN [Chloroflexi bacterium]|nr:DNA repair protein RecN [Chloroflexota bacterium]
MQSWKNCRRLKAYGEPLRLQGGNLLLELRVKDLGIIEDISWNLDCGFNVITGETGAGKSLVIDAVEALLAGKLDEEAIRHGANEACIEGVFALPHGAGNARLKELLAEKGLGNDEDTLVIHCELRRQGRSVFRINGHAVPRSLLQEIGRFLVDVHGQSEHLSLLDRKYQMDFLDAYAHTISLRQTFSAMADELRKTEHELLELAREESESVRREEFLRFQMDEITRAGLKEGEDEELEREQKIISSSEKLKALSYGVYQALQGEDGSRAPAALDQLGEAVEMMKKLADTDPATRQQLDSLRESLAGLEEVARDIRSYSDRLEYDPKRLEEIESRLALIRELRKKYGKTIAEVLDYQKKAGVELEGFAHSSERQAELKGKCARLRQEMGQLAGELSKARSDAARKLASEVKRELRDLNMPQVEFEVEIKQLPDAGGIQLPGRQTCAFSNDGADIIEFIVSTNPGEPLKPVARIASSGELSRFMLALKGALSQADNIPVLVFDEIDTGVGGRNGEIIGKKLWLLARNRQVVCVTHLPQIAAFADAHYSIRKEVAGTRTLSKLEVLRDRPRINELAAMLGGAQYTEITARNASELIKKAMGWKKGQNSPRKSTSGARQ